MDYKKKYLKYKFKYLQLKNQLGGSHFDKELEEAINASLKDSSDGRNTYKFNVIKNNGVPLGSYNPLLKNYSNQCLFISLMDYFKNIRKQEYFIFNRQYLPLNIDSIRQSVGLTINGSNEENQTDYHVDFFEQFATENNILIQFFDIDPDTKDILTNRKYEINTGSQLRSIDDSKKYEPFIHGTFGENSLRNTQNYVPIIHLGSHFELIIKSELLKIDFNIESQEFIPNIKLAAPELHEFAKINNNIINNKIIIIINEIELYNILLKETINEIINLHTALDFDDIGAQKEEINKQIQEHIELIKQYEEIRQQLKNKYETIIKLNNEIKTEEEKIENITYLITDSDEDPEDKNRFLDSLISQLQIKIKEYENQINKL